MPTSVLASRWYGAASAAAALAPFLPCTSTKRGRLASISAAIDRLGVPAGDERHDAVERLVDLAGDVERLGARHLRADPGDERRQILARRRQRRGDREQPNRGRDRARRERCERRRALAAQREHHERTDQERDGDQERRRVRVGDAQIRDRRCGRHGGEQRDERRLHEPHRTAQPRRRCSSTTRPRRPRATTAAAATRASSTARASSPARSRAAPCRAWPRRGTASSRATACVRPGPRAGPKQRAERQPPWEHRDRQSPQVIEHRLIVAGRDWVRNALDLVHPEPLVHRVPSRVRRDRGRDPRRHEHHERGAGERAERRQWRDAPARGRVDEQSAADQHGADRTLRPERREQGRVEREEHVAARRRRARARARPRAPRS